VIGYVWWSRSRRESVAEARKKTKALLLFGAKRPCVWEEEVSMNRTGEAPGIQLDNYRNKNGVEYLCGQMKQN